MTAARPILAAAAVVVAAWFALGVRQTTGTEDAEAIMGAKGRPTAAQLDRADRLLDRAGTLNPDRSVDLLRARLDLARGRFAAAQRRFEAVTRAEPENIEAWTQLAFATVATDRATFNRAAREIRRLSPRVPLP